MLKRKPKNPKIDLPDNSYCTEIKITPKDWKTGGIELLNHEWIVWYRYYNPKYRHDAKKWGFKERSFDLNDYENLTDRRAIAPVIFEAIKENLKEGWNPVSKTYPVKKESPVISPDTIFTDALQIALNKKKPVPVSIKDFNTHLKFIKQAVIDLEFYHIKIKDISRKHIAAILDYMPEINPRWSNNNYNRYRSTISSLYRVLIKYEAAENNPVEYLDKMEHRPKERELLTVEEIKKLGELKTLNYNFWRYIQIFCNGGSRNTEILTVKVKDVDFSKQEFKAFVKKGRKNKMETYSIKDAILHLLIELIKDSPPDYYIFSKGLVPGVKPIRADQIERRWALWVKGKLKINKTEYGLKALNATFIAGELDAKQAARAINVSEEITKKHYDKAWRQRENDEIKKTGNPLDV